MFVGAVVVDGAVVVAGAAVVAVVVVVVVEADVEVVAVGGTKEGYLLPTIPLQHHIDLIHCPGSCWLESGRPGVRTQERSMFAMSRGYGGCLRKPPPPPLTRHGNPLLLLLLPPPPHLNSRLRWPRAADRWTGVASYWAG